MACHVGLTYDGMVLAPTGNLFVRVNVDARRADLYAAVAIAAGEELTFDYGEAFWLASDSVPSEGTDTRFR